MPRPKWPCGADTLATAEAFRELFQELLVDEQPTLRLAALMAGTDIRYPPPEADAPSP